MTAPSSFNHGRAGGPSEDIRVRSATAEDLVALGALAAELVRQHHGYDAARFVLPRDVERGYREWFGRELGHAEAVLLVAEPDVPASPAPMLGYLYGRMEGRDWNLLLDRHAALHDLLVVPEAQGRGVGEALVRRFQEIARQRGLPRVVLHSASPNVRAQRLFAKLGFRPTMLEMTCELGPDVPQR
jgi:ribosomal protein S18 acetylase RimI-like enzyme